MITRGYILVSHPLDKVHDAVLETCKEMNAEVRDIKKIVMQAIRLKSKQLLFLIKHLELDIDFR
jgi:hypothetical protein